jgi:phosphatidylserine decarboxylase
MSVKPVHYEMIAREAYPFAVPAALVSLLCWWLGYMWASFLFLAVTFAIAAFFRNPERQSPTGDDIVLSPADGRIVQIVENVSSPNFPDFPLTRVSIFMSVLNVHVNRWPISGIVEKVIYKPGSFLDAREPDASSANERNSIVVKGKEVSVEVVQIAGLIARRIECWAERGSPAKQGERFGLIRFGSRLDVYLPAAFSPVAAVGAKVRAGLTVLARKA